MIRSFADKQTSQLYEGIPVRKYGLVGRAALRKLLLLHAADTLADLAKLPGNRLEALSGNLAGQYSIRINIQWRICFRWKEGDAHDVRITDYH